MLRPRLLVAASLLVLAAAASAAPIDVELNTSGYLLGASGAPLDQAGVSLGFSLWTDATSTAPADRVWPATPNACSVTVTAGYYTQLLGGPTGCAPGLLSTHLPPGARRWLEVSVAGVTLAPRTLIAAVPTAIRAAEADAVGGEAPAALHDASKLTGLAPVAVLGNLGTAATTNATAYATAAQGVLADGALPRAGGTLTGAVTFPGTGAWTATGAVGIGTTAPKSKLQVAGGEIQTGSSGVSTCDANNAGAIRWDGARFLGCNGTQWGTFSVAVSSGGTIIDAGGYRIHTFTSSGTFTPAAPVNVEVLVVAGGGAGGSDNQNALIGGGGGGGGVVFHASKAVAGATAVVVGVGGPVGAVGGQGQNGGDSSFADIVALGGGGGGGVNARSGLAGGSGGGAGTAGTGGASTQGASGGGTGYGFAGSTPSVQSGGGGGAGAAGASNGTPGTGRSFTISGVATSYGGAGAGRVVPTGGAGGGGGFQVAGTANTGGGGGFGGGEGGHPGGSGIVIVRYPYP